jgi:hypothetical protein
MVVFFAVCDVAGKVGFSKLRESIRPHTANVSGADQLGQEVPSSSSESPVKAKCWTAGTWKEAVNLTHMHCTQP